MKIMAKTAKWFNAITFLFKCTNNHPVFQRENVVCVTYLRFTCTRMFRRTSLKNIFRSEILLTCVAIS